MSKYETFDELMTDARKVSSWREMSDACGLSARSSVQAWAVAGSIPSRHFPALVKFLNSRDIKVTIEDMVRMAAARPRPGGWRKKHPLEGAQ